MKAMIFAAGLGTRLKTLTSDKPKALIELNGKVLLGLQIEKLISFGFDEIIINVHHFAGKVKEYLKAQKYFDVRIEISEEEQLLDTGGGLKKASWFFDDGKPFLLHNVDVVSNLNLKKVYDYHSEAGNFATFVVRERETSRYLLFDEGNSLVGWENVSTGEKIIKKKTQIAKRLAFNGISFLSAEALKKLPDKNVFSLIEFFIEAAESKKVQAYIDKESYWFDIGTPEKLKRAEEFLKAYGRFL